MGWKVPIVSHWGPAGGRFTELAGPSATNVHFVQTYSFFGKQSPGRREGAGGADGEVSGDQGPGRRHARGRHRQRLRRHAPHRAGDRARPARPTAPKIREGFYEIDSYDGLIKTYKQAVHAREPRRARPRTTTSWRTSSTIRSCRSSSERSSQDTGTALRRAAPVPVRVTAIRTGAVILDHLGARHRARRSAACTGCSRSASTSPTRCRARSTSRRAAR